MGRRSAIVLSVVLVAYLLAVGGRGVLLVATGRPAAVVLGLGVLLLPVVGAVLLAGELRLGFAGDRLARAAGPLAGGDEPPEARFETARAAVQAAPGDWRAWYALAAAYQANRDSTNGRRALRRAVELERAARADRSGNRRAGG